MAGVREEFRSKFNPLAAMKAQRCPPVAVMGQRVTPRVSNSPKGDENLFLWETFLTFFLGNWV